MTPEERVARAVVTDPSRTPPTHTWTPPEWPSVASDSVVEPHWFGPRRGLPSGWRDGNTYYLNTSAAARHLRVSRPQFYKWVERYEQEGADELVFLDISATPAGKEPNLELLADIASEAFMPFSYGGGITRLDQIRRLYAVGVEKVVINTAAAINPTLISEAASAAAPPPDPLPTSVARRF